MPGLASGLGKRTRHQPSTAPQADSTLRLIAGDIAAAGGVADVGAAHRLAVQGQHPALLPHGCAHLRRPGGELGEGPGAQCSFQRRGVDPLQDPADGRLVRHHDTDAEHVQHDVAGVVGVLRDRRERPGAGQNRARPDQQHREHAVADTTRRPRVRHRGQGFHQ
jgi:hypothetical protein